MLCRLGSGRGDAEDLAQLTFVTAWSKRSKVPDDPRPWLYATARNHWRNHVRKHWRSMEQLDLETPGGDGGIEDSELSCDLDTALGRLSGEERDVVRLAYLHDLTIEEIAVAIRRNPGAAKQRLHRARRKLRNV